LLDSYGTERKPHVRSIVSSAKSFGLIIGELDEAAARQRDARLRQELEGGKAETVRQKFIPGLQEGWIDSSAGGGTLFVQPWVRNPATGAPSLLDDVTGRGFMVALTDAAALEWVGEDTRAAWERLEGSWVVIGDVDVDVPLPADVLAVEEEEDVFRDFMKSHGAVAAVVRPDRYVYGLAADVGGLRRLVCELNDRFVGR
jgi:3-(3-hydroxy-phenyl)propionate hydroxylase